ncbi:hypothetical protein chiPu_0012715 [Chiloscyllium punctatum]|uniref:Uncharacterized protein n=1 Tax=Chiloscyllium punctatum TaxID=137246 RepID=A0A401SV22_CHIPU|nr:hypothetical protein [Chiloscyllium punctatum]
MAGWRISRLGHIFKLSHYMKLPKQGKSKNWRRTYLGIFPWSKFRSESTDERPRINIQASASLIARFSRNATYQLKAPKKASVGGGSDENE